MGALDATPGHGDMPALVEQPALVLRGVQVQVELEDVRGAAHQRARAHFHPQPDRSMAFIDLTSTSVLRGSGGRKL